MSAMPVNVDDHPDLEVRVRLLEYQRQEDQRTISRLLDELASLRLAVIGSAVTFAVSSIGAAIVIASST